MALEWTNVESFLGVKPPRAGRIHRRFSVRCASTHTRVQRVHVRMRPVQYRLVPRSEPARSSFHSTVSRLEHRESIEKRISGRSLVNYTPSKVERLYSRIVRDRSNERTFARFLRPSFSIPLMYVRMRYIPRVSCTRRVFLNRKISCASTDFRVFARDNLGTIIPSFFSFIRLGQMLSKL